MSAIRRRARSLDRSYRNGAARLRSPEVVDPEWFDQFKNEDVSSLIRPRTRADCINGIRPCPFVGCAYHTYLDVMPGGGIVINFPDLMPWELKCSCVLDEVANGPISWERTADVINVTRTRAQQLANQVAEKIGANDRMLADDVCNTLNSTLSKDINSIDYHISGLDFASLLATNVITSRALLGALELIRYIPGSYHHVAKMSHLTDDEMASRLGMLLFLGMVRSEGRRWTLHGVGKRAKHRLLGKGFGSLTPISRCELWDRKVRLFCRCSCGGWSVVSYSNLTGKHVASCGCRTKELLSISSSRHGYAKSCTVGIRPEYDAWRCLKKKAKRVGKPLVSRWQSFEGFLRDVGVRPDGHVLLSNDTGLKFGPNNTRWAPRKDAFNVRKRKQEKTALGRSA